MSAGLVQLVSTGPQDVHITGEPQVSFFFSNFKRHTNFSVFRRFQSVVGLPHPDGMSTINFERLGDLLGYTYLTITKDGVTQSINDWSNVIDSCELLIGGQVIDTQDTRFTEELAPEILATTYSKSYPGNNRAGLLTDASFYPFRFFFCENWQSAIPLIGLQYHDVTIRIKWSKHFDTTYKVDATACYVSLGDEERVRFTKGVDILITQVQKSTPSGDRIQELSFNHPIKCLLSSNANPAVPNTLVSLTNKIKLVANGVDITESCVSVPHFTAVPSFYHLDYAFGNEQNMFMYSFGLNISKYQPTGTLNFSRVTQFSVHSEQVINNPIYAINYNILRIKDGMGGVLYSN